MPPVVDRPGPPAPSDAAATSLRTELPLSRTEDDAAGRPGWTYKAKVEDASEDSRRGEDMLGTFRRRWTSWGCGTDGTHETRRKPVCGIRTRWRQHHWEQVHWLETHHVAPRRRVGTSGAHLASEVWRYVCSLIDCQVPASPRSRAHIPPPCAGHVPGRGKGRCPLLLAYRDSRRGPKLTLEVGEGLDLASSPGLSASRPQCTAPWTALTPCP